MESDPEPAILLVEDNEVNQLVAAAMLRRRGYDVDVVGNGREALAAIERRPYAAVVMDCQMPEMDGYATTAALRRRGRDLPVIALTAHATPGERERCLAAGMDEFLTKPVRPDELAAALDRVIAPDVVDRGALRRLGDALDAATLARIVDVFLEHGAGYVATIAGTDDEGTMRRTAHTLKGSAATVGAVAVAAIAAEIERTGDRTLASKLAEAFARTRAALDARYLQ